MFQPEHYAANITLLTKNVKQVHVPKILNTMGWNFTNGNILDYGCRTGETGTEFFLPKVKKTNSKMFSVDISNSMVTYARKNHPHDLIQYEQGSLPSPDFPFGHLKFDKIISIHFLHYVPDIQLVLSEFNQILKPGGQIGFTAATKNCPGLKILQYLEESPKWSMYMDQLKNFIPIWSDYGDESPEEYYSRILTEKSGLKIVNFEFVDLPILESEMDIVIGCTMALNPCLPNVPKDKLDDLKTEYRQFLTRIMEVPENTKTITIPSEYLCVVLEKPI